MVGILDQVDWSRHLGRYGIFTVEEVIQLKRFVETTTMASRDMLRTERAPLRVRILESLYGGSYLVQTIRRLVGGVDDQVLYSRLNQFKREGLVSHSASGLWTLTAAGRAYIEALGTL